MTTRHRDPLGWGQVPDAAYDRAQQTSPPPVTMGIDFHLIANFGALALITLAGPAVIFILFYRRGAL
ncbi:Photosystem II reaction center protein Ycf12 (modular protein) [Cyanobium sp. NIES-981]|nr:Photosystem II reaction center protein Ycf12 (modular protein) [Cyanobium sp. NIES-981]